jgi:hypothetical protein
MGRRIQRLSVAAAAGALGVASVVGFAGSAEAKGKTPKPRGTSSSSSSTSSHTSSSSTTKKLTKLTKKVDKAIDSDDEGATSVPADNGSTPVTDPSSPPSTPGQPQDDDFGDPLPLGGLLLAAGAVTYAVVRRTRGNGTDPAAARFNGPAGAPPDWMLQASEAVNLTPLSPKSTLGEIRAVAAANIRLLEAFAEAKDGRGGAVVPLETSLQKASDLVATLEARGFKLETSARVLEPLFDAVARALPEAGDGWRAASTQALESGQREAYLAAASRALETALGR